MQDIAMVPDKGYSNVNVYYSLLPGSVMFQSTLYLHGLNAPLNVSAFHGAEALSESFVLYVLVDYTEAVSSLETPVAAVLVTDTREGELSIHGLLTQVISNTSENCLLLLRSYLELLDTAVPELEFDGMDTPQAVAGLLAGLGLEPGKDFAFHLTDNYEPWPELRSQGDSPFDFLFRILGREGICCLHESTDQGGMLVFSDNPLPAGPASGSAYGGCAAVRTDSAARRGLRQR